MSTENDKEQKEKLLTLVRCAVQRDNALREQYQIGEKFRFVRDRLQALLSRLELNFATASAESEQAESEILADEAIVYVYLYNSQGIKLPTWQKMLNPAVFYEYSVNRPIYAEKSHVEAFIRNKTNKAQHAYLAIVVKKTDSVKSTDEESSKDALGQPLIKVKEGALHFDKLIFFKHSGHEYELNKAGELVKK